MEVPIWLVIALIIAVIAFIIIIGFLNLAREGGMKSLQDIFNLQKFLEIIGVKK